jgi:hypothetical protein
MKKQIHKDLEMEKVPLLVVYKEGDRIKFNSTKNMDHFAILGFLKTYIVFLEEELLCNMAECSKENKNKKSDLGDSEFSV